MIKEKENEDFQSEITIIIKTFERFSSLKRLVKSIVDKYPNIKIIISDDSKNAKSNKIKFFKKFKDLKLIEYLVLPYNVGLSYGRNVALKKVKTKYFVLCDDDFVFFEKTNLLHMLNLLKKNNLDILGGVFYEPKHFFWPINILQGFYYGILYDLGLKKSTDRTHFFEKNIIFIDDETIKISNAKYKKNLIICDIVHNFFIAKTNSLIKNNLFWDNDLKLLEHGEFFLRCKKKGLRVGTTRDVGIYHLKGGFLNYYFFRYRIKKYQNLSIKKMGIKKRILEDGRVQMIK